VIAAWPAIVPLPSTMEATGGWYELTAQTTISCDPGATDCAQLLRDYLDVTGLPLTVGTGGTSSGITLRLIASDRRLGGEGYTLSATTDGVHISALSTTGLLHGIQTLRQLLPPQVYGGEPQPGLSWRIPCVEISDSPRFGWRGSLLDVGRWYLPMDYLYRYVETLAVHKLNRFHLHLTEDQGWRFEVKQHPRLTEIGAWRRESQSGQRRESQRGQRADPRYDGTPHGGFYTHEELRDLVAFAGRRGIEVVPEVDLPGHVTAAIAAYPELGNGPGPLAVAREWGVHSSVLNIDESTLDFVENVIDELIDVFPSPWVHIGGDECPSTEWAASPAVRARMRTLDLDGVEQIQPWFTNRISGYLRGHGRTAVVWDEAVADDLDEATIVMAWRSESHGLEAAARGFQVVMSPQERTYFDWHQTDDPGEPVAQPGVTTLRQVYEYDPSPAHLVADVGRRIIGAQGQLWTEYLPTPQRVDDMAYPRLCALAERAWSSANPSYPDFADRLATHAERLTCAGVALRLGRTSRGLDP
jgi:hexosaminidase